MPRTNSQAAATQAARSRKNVVIYTTSSCPYCVKAKQYFRQKGVSFREVNIESSLNGKDEYRKLNGSGVPLIVIDGTALQGFSPSKLDALL